MYRAATSSFRGVEWHNTKFQSCNMVEAKRRTIHPTNPSYQTRKLPLPGRRGTLCGVGSLRGAPTRVPSQERKGSDLFFCIAPIRTSRDCPSAATRHSLLSFRHDCILGIARTVHLSRIQYIYSGERSEWKSKLARPRRDDHPPPYATSFQVV
jgi:hypothetical protein